MDLFVLAKLVIIVAGVLVFSRTSLGDKVGNYLPTPFWIYFIPILCTTFGFLPIESSTYEILSLHLLPLALVLMLIGTPISDLFKMGVNASWAMILAAGTMIIATFISYALFVKFLPLESYKQAGAILATWVGGSANMLAVKEWVHLSDSGMAPLIIVDTLLSYTWMALLILGAGFQPKMDKFLGAASTGDETMLFREEHLASSFPHVVSGNPELIKVGISFGVILFCFFIAELSLWSSQYLAKLTTLLSKKGWGILLASTLGVLLACTPLRKFENWKASKMGMICLYGVLVTIGAKTTLKAIGETPTFIYFGVVLLLIHGVLLLLFARWLKIPFYFLAIASQANVGGPVSAPLVAGVYRPGLAHVGVLMAVGGALVGTYVGVFGTWICHGIQTVLK